MFYVPCSQYLASWIHLYHPPFPISGAQGGEVRQVDDAAATGAVGEVEHVPQHLEKFGGFVRWERHRTLKGGYLQQHHDWLLEGFCSMKYMVVSINGGSLKWMVYSGKSHFNRWFRGTPISGNFHMSIWGGLVFFSVNTLLPFFPPWWAAQSPGSTLLSSSGLSQGHRATDVAQVQVVVREADVVHRGKPRSAHEVGIVMTHQRVELHYVSFWGGLYGGFHKWGTPKRMVYKGNIPLKWMICGFPYFRKPPYM